MNNLKKNISIHFDNKEITLQIGNNEIYNIQREIYQKVRCEINKRGTRRFYNQNDDLHNNGDEAAEIWSNGAKVWWKNGKPHRDGDKPAVISTNRRKAWYQNGQLHRDGDKPAVIWTNGSKAWYQNGQRHRDGDKPAVIDKNFKVEYWLNGKRINIIK